MGVGGCLGRGAEGWLMLQGYKVSPFGRRVVLWSQMVVMVALNVNLLNITELYTLKWLKW